MSVQKVLLSFEEFKRLKNIEENFEKVNQELSELKQGNIYIRLLHSKVTILINFNNSRQYCQYFHLKAFNFSGKSSQKSQQSTEQVGGANETESEQTGAGLSTHSIDAIADIVLQRLQPRSVNDNWQFYEKTQPSTANVLPLISPGQFNYSTTVTKSDLNSVFDLKKALLKVSKDHRIKASEFLNELEKRSTELTFDKNGTIFSDGESIPGNFYTFFPLLYKKRMPKLDGFQDFFNKIQLMGLDHLVTLTKSRHAVRTSIDKELSSHLGEGSKNNSDPWWLLV